MIQCMKLLRNSVTKCDHPIHYQKNICLQFNTKCCTLISKWHSSNQSSIFSFKRWIKQECDTDSKGRVPSDAYQKDTQGSHKHSLVPSRDPPLLLSVKPHPKLKECKSENSNDIDILIQKLTKKIPSEVKEIYNKWLKDRNSVDITWDSYFQYMLLHCLHGKQSHIPPPVIQSSSACTGSSNGSGGGSSNENMVCPWSQEEFKKKYPEAESVIRDYMVVSGIIRSYQLRGHIESKLDPLQIKDNGINNNIEKHNYMPPETIVRKIMKGVTEKDMECLFELPYFTFIGGTEKYLTLREIIYRLEKVYCQHTGVEFIFLHEADKNQFLRQLIETPGASELGDDTKKKILRRLTKAVAFEKFLATKYESVKRFGLEGGEVLIPALCQIIDMASCASTKSFIIGMAHRGRLNVLANVCCRPLHDLLCQFSKLEVDHGSGDVKYHLGSSITRMNEENEMEVTVTLLPNPSHLETVSPIVIGRTRSEQFFANDEGEQIMSILIHGDAAFAGQGVVYETINLSNLPHFTSRGTIHFVINNQIGFTTDPRFYSSAAYCSDVGLVTHSPIFHVNGDDPEAVIHCCNVALEYRNKYKRDVVIDIVCYRRHGHNETDDPSFTQPLMCKRIKEIPNVLELYSKRLIEENVVTDNEVKEMKDEYMNLCEKEYLLAQKEKKMMVETWLDKSWNCFFKRLDPNKIPSTGVKEGVLKHVGVMVSSPPPSELNFDLHKKVEKLLAQRMDLLREMTVDWPLAEAMAFGSLLMEGYHVRMSGEDVERGTFSHRHCAYHHQSKDMETYVPLKHLSDNQGDCTICNSSLCEYAIVGFELGYSMTNPNVLVMWEAQFGDFLNTAQTIVDCYLSSQEAKWGRQTGLVLLLPHGMEGAGPDHSSARIERFLLMCDDDPDELPCLKEEEDIVNQLRDVNWTVAYPSTPASYFHLLRRQMKMPFRKPLILFTPKYMLKGNGLRSPLSEMSEGTEFQRVLSDTGPAFKNPKMVKRLIFCTGRVYYDLVKERCLKKLQEHIAIARIEQLCPFPYDLVKTETFRYPNAEICWVQEEHKNSGAWSYIFPRFSTALEDCEREVLVYIGRPSAASTAVGNVEMHNRELKQLMNDALDLGFPSSGSSGVGRYWPAKK